MQRLATGFVLAAGLVVCLFLLPSLAWLAVLTLFVAACAHELGSLLSGRHPGSPGWALPLVAVATLATVYGSRLLPEQMESAATALLAAVVVVLPAICALLTGKPKNVWPAVPWITFGAVYCALPAVFLFDLREQSGPWLVVLLLGLVGVGDSAAYYVGKSLGRHKLAPELSPKKTWVGSAGGVLGALLFAAVWSWMRLERIDLLLLALAGATQVVGQFGDLLESAIKRTSGVKDSGSVLPGHGGFLDRADATLLGTPVFFLGVSLFGSSW